MIAHDRQAARQAFETALALSPSCALTYMFGSVITVYAAAIPIAPSNGASARSA